MLDIISCLLIGISLGASPAQELFCVKAEGAAAGRGSKARASAVEQAETAAVIEVLKSWVASGDLSPLQPIIGSAPNYVHSVRELRCLPSENDVRVEIEAKLYYATLRRDAARLLLPTLAYPPKVVVVLSEKVDGEDHIPAETMGEGEAALVQSLREATFDVVDRSTVRDLYAEPELLALLSSDSETCGRFARANLADVVVLGCVEKTVEKETPDAVFSAVKAAVTLRVIRATDNQLMETWTARSTVHSATIDDGAVVATRDACAKLRDGLIEAVVLAVAGASRNEDVILTVARVGEPGRIEEIRNRLREKAEVGDVEELYCSSNLARLRVAYSEALRPLVDWVVSGKYSTFSLTLEKAVGREITVSLVTE